MGLLATEMGVELGPLDQATAVPSRYKGGGPGTPSLTSKLGDEETLFLPAPKLQDSGILTGLVWLTTTTPVTPVGNTNKRPPVLCPTLTKKHTHLQLAFPDKWAH